LSEIAVIADEDTVVGFRLAGVVRTHVHSDPARTEAFIRDMMTKNVGVVVITHAVAAQIPGFVDRLRREKGRVEPIIVEIPDKGGPLEYDDGLRKMIRRVVGTDMVLEV